MLLSDATALPVKPVLGHSLQGHAKIEMPLAGSVDVKVKRKARAQNVVQPFLDDIPALQHRQSTLTTCADDAQ